MFLLSFHSIKLKPILEHSLLLYIIGFHNSSFRAEWLGDSPNPSRRPLHTRPLPSSLRLALTFCVSCSTVGGQSLLLCWTQAFLLSEPFLTSPVLLCVRAWRSTPVLCASQAPGVWLALASRRHGGGWRAWEEGEPWAASLAGPWLQSPSEPQVPWLASLSLLSYHMCKSFPLWCTFRKVPDCHSYGHQSCDWHPATHFSRTCILQLPLSTSSHQRADQLWSLLPLGNAAPRVCVGCRCWPILWCSSQ